MNYFFKKLNEDQKNIFVIVDCAYHFKNLYFFKKNFFYSIGLISLSLNP